MYLLFKNLIGRIMITINYILGDYSLPLANLIMVIFRKNVSFQKRPDISPHVYQVKEKLNRFPNQDDLHHFFHMSQRLHNYVVGVKKKGQRLAESYGIDRLELQPNDVILDVGANSGDSLIYFKGLGIPLSIYCFEPDPKAIQALQANAANWSECVTVIPHALGEKEGSTTFYVSTLGGDSSLSRPPSYEQEIDVDTLTLDQWYKREHIQSNGNKKIKLIKLEAEGFEPEILKGGLSILRHVQYVAADLGWERGLEQECTIPHVVNLLLTNQFKVTFVSSDGVHFLFENMAFSDSPS
jgi:FkbM family methyltransferase